MPVKSWTSESEARLVFLKGKGLANQTIVDRLQQEFPGEAFSLSKVKSKLGRMKTSGTKIEKPAPRELTVEEHVQKTREQRSESATKTLNRQLTERVEKLTVELATVKDIKQTAQTYTIHPRAPKKLSATQVLVWSDWHVEELVRGATINHLNEFNLAIAEARIQACIHNSARLMEITAKETPIDEVVLFLGGDFISGHLHEGLKSNTCLLPAAAITWVKPRIKAGIEHLLAHTDKDIVIVCHSGNHARMTEKVHFENENGNSLEYIMYHFLRDDFAHEPRIKWVIAEGYHTYFDLYGKTIRFHHGHAVKYGGGVGGVFIPAFKAISQWNKAKHADLDVFGHFHQLKNGGNFIINGSLIGYNAYALSIKADFERPRQKFFMYSSTGEVISEHPIFLE
jgi:hypothetical protein